MKVLATVIGATFIVICGNAKASFLDNQGELSGAISALRSAIGTHPRVLNITVYPEAVTIEAQDSHNPLHVNRWKYNTSRVLGIVPMRSVTGPDPVELQLVNPDLEANLFDLDAVAFTALLTLKTAAIERAHLQDKAAITRMEIERQTFILPKPSSGDIRCTFFVSSGRESAEVFANAQGEIVGADLRGTQWAQSLNLFKEPGPIVDAAAAFRAALGADRILTEVRIDPKLVTFSTSIRDKTNSLGDLPATDVYTWDLNGLVHRPSVLDVNTLMRKNLDTQLSKGPTPFSVDEVDWTIIGKLEENSLAKLEAAQTSVSHLQLEKSSTEPGEPVLEWTVEVTGPNNETMSAVADAKGTVKRLVLPESSRPKVAWMDPVTLARAIARIGTIFGSNVKIASIEADDRGAKVTVDDPANGNQPATFDFTGDSVSRSAFTFSLSAAASDRFGVTDLGSFTEQKIALFEEVALKKLSKNKKAYLESVTIGPQLFVPQAGARAIEVRIRDTPQDSPKSEGGWIVFNFAGRVLDFSAMD